MRFVAPARTAVDPVVFERPPLSQWREFEAFLRGPQWPDIQTLNALQKPSPSRGGLGGDGVATATMRDRSHSAEHDADAATAPDQATSSDTPPVPPRFVEQTPALLADCLHYEQRIAERGEIATRSGNWHDLLNALVWLRFPQLKAALNARQVAEIAIAGPRRRTRAQCALTHFDEAGVIVLVRDPALLALWDAHDWLGLFRRERAAWTDGRIAVQVFGHALLEHALRPHQLVAGKALVVRQSGQVENAAGSSAAAAAAVARAIATGALLADPQELRPLPLCGIPGWHAQNGADAFYRDAPCFRPLPPGRRYPPPLV